MPRSQLLELARLAQASLEEKIPILIDEVNLEVEPTIELSLPAAPVQFGIRTDMLDRTPKELPVVAVGFYTRNVHEEGEQEFSTFDFEFIIDVYLADVDATNIFIRSHKWAIVLDQWTERFASTLLPGYVCVEAPEIEISYVLELPREATFRQLVTVTGLFTGAE